MKAILVIVSCTLILTLVYGSHGQSQFPELLPHHALSVNWNVQGDTYITTHLDGSVRLYDDNGLARTITQAHDAPVWDATFDPSGTRVATIGDDETIRIWNTTNGAVVDEILSVGELLETIDWSPSGSQIFVSSFAEIAYVVHADVSNDVYSLTNQFLVGVSLASQWSPNSNSIAVGLRSLDLGLVNISNLATVCVKDIETTS